MTAKELVEKLLEHPGATVITQTAAGYFEVTDVFLGIFSAKAADFHYSDNPDNQDFWPEHGPVQAVLLD